MKSLIQVRSSYRSGGNRSSEVHLAQAIGSSSEADPSVDPSTNPTRPEANLATAFTCLLQSSNGQQPWEAAVSSEKTSLEELEALEFVDQVPRHANVIDGKLVLQRKLKVDGLIDKHKARLIARPT